ncbi:MAG: hypothetical protein RLZ98_2728 [Pseudomonadota bacterium]|jgi:tripartite-type tricarboxylate transporter receptor subunit TctC
MKMLRSTASVIALAGIVGAGLSLSSVESHANDFYNGKTVRLIVGFSPGGGYDTYARALARQYGKHIPGNPSVIVQNMPGAGSVKSIQYIDVGAPTDGTVINSFNNGVLIESLTNPAKVKVKLNNYHYIGSTTRDFRVCYAWHATGIKSVKEIMGGGKQFIIGGTSKGASSYLNAALLGNVIGVNVKHVLGFPGSAEVRIAVERGETSGDCGSYSSIPDDWIKNNKIVPLVQFSKEKSDDMPAGIPYAGDLVDDQKKKEIIEFVLAPNDIGKPYIVSKKVPMDRVKILREAFNATMKDPEFLAHAKKLTLPITPFTGEQAVQVVAKIYSATPETIKAAIKAVD